MIGDHPIDQLDLELDRLERETRDAADAKVERLRAFAAHLRAGGDPLDYDLRAGGIDAVALNNAYRTSRRLRPNPFFPRKVSEPYVICELLLERWGEWVTPAEVIERLRERGTGGFGRRQVQIQHALSPQQQLRRHGYQLEKRPGSPVAYRLVEYDGEEG